MPEPRENLDAAAHGARWPTRTELRGSRPRGSSTLALRREKTSARGAGDAEALRASRGEAAARSSREAQSAPPAADDRAQGRRRTRRRTARRYRPNTLTGMWSADVADPAHAAAGRNAVQGRPTTRPGLPGRDRDRHPRGDPHLRRRRRRHRRIGAAIGADGDETSRKEAWRKLVDTRRRSPRRPTSSGARSRPTGTISATVGVGGLTFPVRAGVEGGRLDTAAAGQGASRSVRADAVARRRGRSTVPGGFIPDIVHAGPAPLTSTAIPRGSAARDGRMEFDAESEWLADFEIAVDEGTRIPRQLGPADAGGLRRTHRVRAQALCRPADDRSALTELSAATPFGQGACPRAAGHRDQQHERRGRRARHGRLVRRRELRRAAGWRRAGGAPPTSNRQRRRSARGVSRAGYQACSRACHTPTGATMPRPSP